MIFIPFILAAGAAAQWSYVNSEVYKADDELIDLQTKVTITVPTLNEEENVERTLKSLREQNLVKAYPDMFEITVVDSYSQDDTMVLSIPYIDTFFPSPKGLLTARAIATANATGDIIVNANADIYYPPNYLNTLLKPYEDEEVVGVCGMAVPPGITGVIGMEICAAHLKPWLFGSASSFRKWAYDEVGGFNLDIDQGKYSNVFMEEENWFAQRLATVGKVVWEPRALAISAMRPYGHSWL